MRSLMMNLMEEIMQTKYRAKVNVMVLSLHVISFEVFI